MSDYLETVRQALEQPINKPSYWPSETTEDYDERLREWLIARDVERDAAGRLVRLAETGPDYEAAAGVLLEKLVEAEDKGLSAGTLAVVSSSIAPLIVDAALADYLTEEET